LGGLTQAEGGLVSEHLERLRQALADRYRMERELGQGGMATVYLAEDLRHQRKVALKVLRPELAAALGGERFHREIQIAAQLQHPHILPLLDSGEAAGLLYYVMPFVEGHSLRERLAREGALPVGDTVHILRDVVDALTEAHAHGVVHRDIKPENIMLRGRHALVTDFGVAKAVSEATGRQTLTTAGVALGTPAYMAPEQASADPHLDHRVDIYAVGAVAYELLTGRPVFMGTTPQMVLSAHVTEAPVPVTRLRETVPRALEALVMRCLEKRPADRWQSAEELLPQLEALATPSGGITPTDTAPLSAAAPRHGLGRVRPLWVAVAVAVVVVAAVAVVAVEWRSAGRGGAPDITRLQVTSTGTAYTPVIAPDGSQVAYAAVSCSAAQGCTSQLVVRDLATEAEQPIVRGAAWITPLRFSPDGARILFLASLPPQGMGAYLVSRIGGSVVRLFAASDSLRGVDFLPGGDTVLAHLGGELRSVLVASGQVVHRVQLPTDLAASLRGVSADGRWIVLERPSTYWGATTLLLADRAGRVVDSLGADVAVGSARWCGSGTLLALQGAVYLGLEHPVLRWNVSSRSGRARGPDTVLVALARDAPDVSGDGRSLVLGGLSAGESELWTLEPAAHSVLRPIRKVVGSTGTLWAGIAADGRTLAYVVESADPRGRNLRVFVADFAGGHSRALTPPIPVDEWSDMTLIGYYDDIYVATPLSDSATRIVAYDVATGLARPFVEVPGRDVFVWPRPDGGLLWNTSGAADTLHVVDDAGRTVALLPDPATTGGRWFRFSPDRAEVVARFVDPAEGRPSGSEMAVYALSVVDGRSRLLARIPAFDGGYPTMWGSDGWIRFELATPQNPRFIVYRIPAGGGAIEPEFISPFDGPCNCSASTDGRRWVGVRAGTRSDVVLIRGFDRALR
jgi:tRNA A-37 threonylcarbamoyl transferase component Bud32/Tol biopolymer transport system component